MDKRSVVQIWEEVWSTDHEDATHILESRYAKEAFTRLNRFIGPDARNVLEGGCGTGRLCAMLAKVRPHIEVTGVDLSEAGLRVATSLKQKLNLTNLTFQMGDLFDLPYPNECFDAVFAEGVLQHFPSGGDPSMEDGIRELIRVLAPGGTLVICSVNWHCYPHTMYKWWLKKRKLEYEYGYERSFTRAELEALLIATGMGNVKSTGYYPSHGFHRLHYRYGSRVSRLCGLFIDLIETPWLAEHFGFEIMVKGTKPI